MSTTLKIRQLVPSDARVVSHFTQELAKFLKCPDGPKLSTKEIEHHLREKLFSGFVAYVGEVPVGVSTFSITYSSWKGPFMHSEDMYILQEYRRCGLAVKFLNEQFRFAKEHNLSRVEYDAMYWNVPIINLLQKMGAANMTKTEGWLRFRIDDEQIKKLVEKANKDDSHAPRLITMDQ